ncbi:YgiQ family radical SAM protein [Alkalimarinus sediminis]|uniref:YgiQ family radical SAM protein n=1 Tax=Alkalimarinus sediminis TaxID=1632866 RepID=A0A9E8HL91_9ALTE|nr:YgiQ family radical SAM protein [Alkalimarinus sediminis]UZW76390.1 YgiQ family radical SAM protein [Alkalimarinus sediminis]
MQPSKSLFSYPKYWAECYGTAPFLPMSRQEMDELGWDSCDIIIISGDAYVDHPSFGMAVVGRLLEAQGFRVGIIAQPDWSSKDEFMKLGKPNLFFAVSAGNMDSMINRYTSDLKIRHDDAYTPNNEGGKRPDRAVIVYTQRCKEAYKDRPVLIGGIEASLRRIAHYDYWSDKVRRSVLQHSKADLLFYGNAERALVEVSHRIANGEDIKTITNVRGTAVMLSKLPRDWEEKDSTRIDKPGKAFKKENPYNVPGYSEEAPSCTPEAASKTEISDEKHLSVVNIIAPEGSKKTYIRLPSFEKVSKDPVLYAHTSRVLHLETNPSNALTLVQQHGERFVWLNPPPIPLSTDEMDNVFEQAFQRVPHPSYGDATIPAYEMIRFSVNIMRGCFGGCSFCSITEHEGRIIQNRSEDSIVREIEAIRDKTPGFTGTISDLGGPTANMYQLACKSDEIQASCRRLSCVYPTICTNLITDHSPTTQLYRRARKIKGIKRIMIASGLRYDLAVEDPEYIKELVTHHVGGYLKIAPEHTEDAPLSKMMKPGMGTYHRFKELFDKYSKEAGKQQFLIPYFISAHPGTTDEDMMNLAIWLKANGFKADQVQNFYPSPMANATTMYHTARDPLHRLDYKSKAMNVPKGARQRRLHKAFLRYHDPDNWPLLREALKRMGKSHLIGNGEKHLVPATQPIENGKAFGNKKRTQHNTRGGAKLGDKQNHSRSRKPRKGEILTQHTGLPPREQSEPGASNNGKRRSKPRPSRKPSRR